VSDKEEKVNLSWPAGDPKSLHVYDVETKPGRAISNELTVPPYGLLVLEADFFENQ
jgi:hypothetical protein